MAWPPGVLPVNRTDALTQQTNHPADHNAVNQAVNDVVAEMGLRGRFLAGQIAGGSAGPNGSLNVSSIAIPAGFAGRPALFVHNLYTVLSGTAGYSLVLLNPAVAVVASKLIHQPLADLSDSWVIPVTALTTGTWIVQMRTDGSNNTTTVNTDGTGHSFAVTSYL